MASTWATAYDCIVRCPQWLWKPLSSRFGGGYTADKLNVSSSIGNIIRYDAMELNVYVGHYTYHISSAWWGFPILAAAAFMRALRVRLTE
ncbi:uncharacterized protein N7498_008077 [Penicillium cinerascens]|uniref:Uncharacterized protein n=1 Tax=Penicillium cinerascens TaxID=70096 RepID=A0A9W9JCR0_9EURO|nr:uncharacterized protein N7498_008077 [Penicillium cinerascens]KAJ5194639.1 hypothetical protein N7498_008077 [Penicillium cinerascens]